MSKNFSCPGCKNNIPVDHGLIFNKSNINKKKIIKTYCQDCYLEKSSNCLPVIYEKFVIYFVPKLPMNLGVYCGDLLDDLVKIILDYLNETKILLLNGMDQNKWNLILSLSYQSSKCQFLIILMTEAEKLKIFENEAKCDDVDDHEKKVWNSLKYDKYMTDLLDPQKFLCRLAKEIKSFYIFRQEWFDYHTSYEDKISNLCKRNQTIKKKINSLENTMKKKKIEIQNLQKKIKQTVCSAF